MSQKRMFDKSILETDDFLDMPMATKALYFLLGMEADDEGFVSPRRVMRLYGGNEDDLKILIAKNFAIKFESGVIVITHWKENNYLDKNRIKETRYQAEKSLLSTKGNKYSMLNECLTDVKPTFNQYSIEEYSIEENSIDSELPLAVKKEKTDISKLLDVFYKFNPGMNFGNKTERSACEWLIKEYGEEKAINTAKYALSVQCEKYAPRVTTPHLLKTKIGDLLAYYKKQTETSKVLNLDELN